jgi:uncharacterized repeat protein (TIGR03803 family)
MGNFASPNKYLLATTAALAALGFYVSEIPAGARAKQHSGFTVLSAGESEELAALRRPSQNPPYGILHYFGLGGDGAEPVAGLIADSSGAMYGTTTAGGAGNCACGTVYKLAPTPSGYVYSTLYTFQGGLTDGDTPVGELFIDGQGALYGTTQYGGPYPGGSSSGYGVVFKLTPSGSGYVESIIHFFHGAPDGSLPRSGLIADSAGALYGTTSLGGLANPGCGTVYRLTSLPSGYHETILTDFKGNAGCSPNFGNLLLRKNGALYGTTTEPGNGGVFEMTPARKGYKVRALYRFQGPPNDGASPSGTLIADDKGSLFGTTYAGGPFGGGFGYGTVYKLVHRGSTYRRTILHFFEGWSSSGPDDGALPLAGVIADKAGNLYGTTFGGGLDICGAVFGSQTCGSVFELTPSVSGYSESLLHLFAPSGPSGDGCIPSGPLLAGPAGTFYGTATYCASGGVIFALTS